MKNSNNENYDFDKIIAIIESTKERIYTKINEEAITMYFNIGQFISKEMKSNKYGDLYIQKMAIFLKQEYPDLKGFDKRNLYKIKQFYEMYADDNEALKLLTGVNWSSHRVIMTRCKTMDSKIFYMNICVRDRLSVRELERQIDSLYYERCLESNVTLTPAIERSKERTKHIFLNLYSFDFTKITSEVISENELEKAIVNNMKDFILEIGKDFTFIKEEYPIEVGGQEFYIDLLFYHRGLQCLVAFELKVGDFKPEYVSKMDFYLEALDRKVKKESENPSVGIILCTGKNNEVVEYALSRTLSPTMVAEYKLKLIDKEVLTKKLREYAKFTKNDDI